MSRLHLNPSGLRNPIKSVTTEAVAKGLVDIYSRLGIPEEVLSDLGHSLFRNAWRKVSRLLSIKQLTTTPYHSMCNGLVKKSNGTLKGWGEMQNVSCKLIKEIRGA